MKKFAAIMLSLVLVFAVAIVASAAPTVSGEVDFGKNFQTNSNISFGKIGVDANIGEGMNAHVAFKADPIMKFDNPVTPTASVSNPVVTDEAWFQIAKDFGTIKVGNFAYNQKGGVDALNTSIDDIKTGLTGSYSLKLNDAITINAAAANDDVAQGLVYSAGVAYATDNFGGDVNYVKPVVGVDSSAIDLNAWYKMNDLKLFANYEDNQAQTRKDTIIGATYDSAKMPVYARGEMNLAANSASVSPYAVRLGYKMNNNVKFEYQYKQDLATPAATALTPDQYLKAIVTF